MSNGAAISMTEKHNSITHTVKSISQKLFGFIRERVDSIEDAEDILQDVLYQFAGKADGIEDAGSWLFSVARNKITDSYRKQKLPLAEDIFSTSEDDESNWRDLLLAEPRDPEEEQLKSLFWEALEEALNELPPEQKDVFIMNELEDIPFKDIAAVTGVNIATLISRKRYAVLHLRERLETLKNELLNY
jgi:RNA polymerase sigma factor (sigma-70 family)